MTDTTNLALELWPAGALSPEVVHNDNMLKLDASVAGTLSIEFTSDANLTLTEAQYQNSVLIFTDSVGPTLTTGRDVIFPAHFPQVYVKNSTAQTLTLKKSGQTGVALTTGTDGIFISGASDVVRGSGGSGAVTSVNGSSGAVDTFGTGLDVDATGFRGIPQNIQSGNYTCVAADAGKEIYHPSGAGAGDTFTIPANGSVAYEIGTAITFTNMDSNALSIAITTDTLYLAGAGTTGTRTLAQYGTATAAKKTSTTWLISGINLT